MVNMSASCLSRMLHESSIVNKTADFYGWKCSLAKDLDLPLLISLIILEFYELNV